MQTVNMRANMYSRRCLVQAPFTSSRAPLLRHAAGHCARAAGVDAADTDSNASSSSSSLPTVTLKLRKPVGLVFAQNKGGPVFVEEITPGGAAAATGAVAVGDVLTRCSAVVLKAGKEGQYEREGYGQRPYDNWETIMFDCEGLEFKTVMSALKSNNERWGIKNVTLVFRKPAPTEQELVQPQQQPPAKS